MGHSICNYRQRRLAALLKIRQRGRVPSKRGFSSRKARLLGYNNQDGAIFEDSSGLIRCSRQEMAISMLRRFVYIKQRERRD